MRQGQNTKNSKIESDQKGKAKVKIKSRQGMVKHR